MTTIVTRSLPRFFFNQYVFLSLSLSLFLSLSLSRLTLVFNYTRITRTTVGPLEHERTDIYLIALLCNPTCTPRVWIINRVYFFSFLNPLYILTRLISVSSLAFYCRVVQYLPNSNCIPFLFPFFPSKSVTIY